jgi:two-component system chemotaxis response regulator CheV
MALVTWEMTMGSILDGVNRLTQLVGRNKLELLMFRLGSPQRFGINVFKVREVVKCPALTKVPHAHSIVCGIANMRGKTITVIDLSAAVGRPPLPPGPDNLVIVTEYNRHIQGFLVSGVDRIVNKNWEEINPPPKGIGRQNYLTAVTSVDSELVEIIDVEKVLADVIGLKFDVSPGLTAAVADRAGRLEVVFADDSSIARKHIVRVLEQLNVGYTMAENGKAAWDLLLAMAADEATPVAERILMVISDIEMPEMDGYTLTKLIKEHPALKSLYVCLHTSLSGSFNVAMSKQVGADKLLSKFDPDELAQVVRERLTSVQSSSEPLAA